MKTKHNTQSHARNNNQHNTKGVNTMNANYNNQNHTQHNTQNKGVNTMKNTQNKKLIALAAAGLLTFSLLAACAKAPVNYPAPLPAQPQAGTSVLATPAPQPAQSPAATPVANPAAAPAPAPAPAAAPVAGDIGLAKACEIAMQNAGVDPAMATITKQKPDYEDGFAVYDIEFVAGGTKYQYEIGAADGSLREASKEAVAQGLAPVNGQITADAAKGVALAQAGLTEAQVTITKLNLEYDDGRAEYDVDFVANGMKYAYTIDATTGAILNAETEMR